MEKPSESTQASAIEYRKLEDFAEYYANNAQLESTLWDLKLIFGHTDQQIGPWTVIQNAAVTLSWAQAKVLAYFLTVHLDAHEVQNGRIQIPTNIVRPPAEPSRKDVEENPKLTTIHAAFVARYEAFVKANPEAAAVIKPKKR